MIVAWLCFFDVLASNWILYWIWFGDESPESGPTLWMKTWWIHGALLGASIALASKRTPRCSTFCSRFILLASAVRDLFVIPAKLDGLYFMPRAFCSDVSARGLCLGMLVVGAILVALTLDLICVESARRLLRRENERARETIPPVTCVVMVATTAVSCFHYVSALRPADPYGPPELVVDPSSMIGWLVVHFAFLAIGSVVLTATVRTLLQKTLVVVCCLVTSLGAPIAVYQAVPRPGPISRGEEAIRRNGFREHEVVANDRTRFELSDPWDCDDVALVTNGTALVARSLRVSNHADAISEVVVPNTNANKAFGCVVLPSSFVKYADPPYLNLRIGDRVDTATFISDVRHARRSGFSTLVISAPVAACGYASPSEARLCEILRPFWGWAPRPRIRTWLILAGSGLLSQRRCHPVDVLIDGVSDEEEIGRYEVSSIERIGRGDCSRLRVRLGQSVSLEHVLRLLLDLDHRMAIELVVDDE